MKKLLCIIAAVCGVYSGFGQTFNNLISVPGTVSGTTINLTVKDSVRQFMNGVSTNTFSINEESYLGPTLILQQGDMVDFNVTNNLAVDTITVHWHGFHVPAQWDGGPASTILPGASWHPSFEIMEHASMMWYHSHAHQQTQYQVSKGLAGMIIIQDPVEAQLNLPRTYGVDDYPLIIQDKSFHNVSGQIEPDLLGNTMLVNGMLDPYAQLPAQVVRLRMINTSVERVFNIGFSDNRNFYQIGTDGGLLEAPVTLNRVPLAPGERAEVLVDLTSENPGTDLYLKSYSTEFLGTVAGSCNNGPGCGTGSMDSTDFEFMRINVVNATGSPVTTIPNALVSIDFIPEVDIDTTRIKMLLNPSSPGQPFTINGGSFDMNTINDIVRLGNREIWRFENQSQIAHPMHIHDVQFNILRRNGNSPPDNEKGWKDVVLVYPDETVEVIAEFLDYADPDYTYMIHCHSLGHEDYGMMEQFIVVDTITTNVPTIIPNKLSLYPNPSQSSITIELMNWIGNGQLKITNSLGQVVLQESFTGIKRSIEISSLESGLYFISLDGNNTLPLTAKFLKN